MNSWYSGGTCFLKSSSFVSWMSLRAALISHNEALKILFSAGLRFSRRKDTALIMHICWPCFSGIGIEIPFVVAAVGAQFVKQ